MLIRMSNNAFARRYKNDIYVFNQENWSSIFIKDAAIFCELFTRRDMDLERYEASLSRRYNVVMSKIRADVEDLVGNLVESGILLDDTWRNNDVNESSAGSISEDGLEDQDERENAVDILCGLFEKDPTPFELCIDLTRACTERCVHCYVPGFQNVFLPYEIVEKVLAEFASMGGLKVKLTGGECMLHRGFERIVALARAHDMVISVLSNLTCCDEAKARAMRDAGVAVVQVSLYGMTPETHETVTRVKGSLEKTMRGIDCLRSAGVPVQIHCPVLKQNVSGVDAVAQFGRKMGMKTTFDAVMMSRADHGRTEECGLSDAELKRFVQTHEDLSGASVACPDADPDARVCEVGTAKICLSAEGKYYPCNGCYGYELGDCRRQTLAEVWNDEPIKQLRKLRMRDLSACAVCENRAFCTPCPARNFNANGHVSLPDQAKCRAAACRRELVECANERN